MYFTYVTNCNEYCFVKGFTSCQGNYDTDIMYEKDGENHQFFVTIHWPGGLYGTPGIAGSRSGVFISSAWISMMKLGRKGFE